MSKKISKLQLRSNEIRISRRRFCLAFLGAFLVPCVGGCSTTKSQKKKKNEEFDEEESDEDGRSNAQSSELSDCVAQVGRGSKEKKKTSKGETFLLSDKAREIYANTER